MEKLLKKLKNVQSLEALEATLDECTSALLTATEIEKEQIKTGIEQKSNEILLASKETRRRADKLLSQMDDGYVIEHNGERYPLSEWLTITEYCDLFKIKSTSVVTNWIRRGIVPTENILKIKRLNNIQLIRAVPYS